MKYFSTLTYSVYIISILGVLSCKPFAKKHKHINVSFYYWKQEFKLSSLEKETLDRLHVQELYVKFFDVLLHDGRPQPVADVVFSEIPPQHISPCVFITNETIRSLDHAGIDTLAHQVNLRITQILDHYHITRVAEIHFDCDWTPSTQERFFRFLKAIQSKSKYKNTSTLRLYQLKYYQKAGIPPVSSVSLMCYNMFSPQNMNVSNSIYDPKELKKYTSHIADYPVKLNLALPLYSWVCIFRDGKFQGFINEVTSKQLDREYNVKKVAENKYKCQKTYKFKGTILSKGDLLRVEEPNIKDLQAGLDDLSSKLPQDTIKIIWYHLDEKILKNYEENILPTICHQ